MIKRLSLLLFFLLALPVFAADLGDVAEDSTIHFQWTTNDSNGEAITRSTDGTISVYKDNGTTQSVAGITDTEDFDGVTGLHACTIDLSSDAFYAAGANYVVTLTGAVVDTRSVTAALATFSIENRFMRGTEGAAVAGDSMDILSISGDVAAANNLESQYDETGLVGDTFPANQSQINQIANVSGIAKRAASGYVLTSGTQSANTVSATEELDGVLHEHTDDAGTMDLYYEFDIGAGIATEVKLTGYLQGNNDDLEVYGFDWVSTSWKQIGELSGQASSINVVEAFDLLLDMVGSGANEGLVRVRFFDGAFTLTGATLAIDQILVEFAQSVEGYQNGAVWLDTNVSNTNVVRGVDGTATNPVSTIAAVNTLLASTNLSRVEVAPQSSITFAVSQENQRFSGKNWTLVLGGQSISGSYIEGADVSGIATGASEVHFDHCHFGAITLPPGDLEFCVLEGLFSIGSEGSFFFENCKSGVAGTGTPGLDFGSALNSSSINFRAWSGGIEVQNMGAGTGSYNMSLEGWGQLIINANCSATSLIAIRGDFPITDNAGGAVTISDVSRFDSVQLVDDIMDEVITAAEHNVVNSLARRIRELDEQIGYQDGAIWIDSADGSPGDNIGENGTVNNPVDNITDALSLAVSIGISRLHVASGSSITLVAAVDGYEFFNANWDLYLGGQSISGSCIHGAAVSGIATGVVRPKFIDCQFGAVTLPASMFINCGIGSGGGTFTGGAAGEFVFHECFSLVPGSGTPAFVFTGLGASTGINNRAWKGGANYNLDDDCTLSHEVLTGGGTTITTGGGDVEVRGITRSLTIIASAAETVQFVGTTGPIALSGTTTAVINLYGVSASLSNTTSAATVTDLTLNLANIGTESDGALSDYDGPTNAEMNARTLLANVYATSASLATHDGKLDAVDTVVDAIKVVTDKIDDTLHFVSGLWGFTTASLATAPGGAAPTVEEIDAEITANHGSGSYITGGAGSGSISWLYNSPDGVTDTSTGLPLAQVKVFVTTDVEGLNRIASGFTDAFGHVTFLLDPGTYYFWKQRAGYEPDLEPDVEVVE